MVSKTRKQRQKRKSAMEANGGVLPPVIPSERKSVHLKKTRPRMKGKMKIRLGHESPVDIYEGFEGRKGVLWCCPNCSRECRVVGFCVDCASGTKSRKHTGVMMSRHVAVKKEVTLPVSAGLVKKKLKLKKRAK